MDKKRPVIYAGSNWNELFQDLIWSCTVQKILNCEQFVKNKMKYGIILNYGDIDYIK